MSQPGKHMRNHSGFMQINNWFWSVPTVSETHVHVRFFTGIEQPKQWFQVQATQIMHHIEGFMGQRKNIENNANMNDTSAPNQHNVHFITICCVEC